PDPRRASARVEAHDQHRELLHLIALDHADLVVVVVGGEAVLRADRLATGQALADLGAHLALVEPLEHAALRDLGEQSALGIARVTRGDWLAERCAQARALVVGLRFAELGPT